MADRNLQNGGASKGKSVSLNALIILTVVTGCGAWVALNAPPVNAGQVAGVLLVLSKPVLIVAGVAVAGLLFAAARGLKKAKSKPHEPKMKIVGNQRVRVYPISAEQPNAEVDLTPDTGDANASADDTETAAGYEPDSTENTGVPE